MRAMPSSTVTGVRPPGRDDLRRRFRLRTAVDTEGQVDPCVREFDLFNRMKARDVVRLEVREARLAGARAVTAIAWPEGTSSLVITRTNGTRAGAGRSRPAPLATATARKGSVSAMSSATGIPASSGYPWSSTVLSCRSNSAPGLN